MTQELINYDDLRFFIDYLKPEYKTVVDPVVHDCNFYTWPGSTDKHHAYINGLAQHTYEVLSYCVHHVHDVNYQILFTAAIWHDYAKLLDYGIEGGKFFKTPYTKLIRHVVGSYEAFCRAAEREHLPTDFIQSVGHCILAHHGRLEWGSPVEPTTPEALILHQADYYSSRFGLNR